MTSSCRSGFTDPDQLGTVCLFVEETRDGGTDTLRTMKEKRNNE